MSKGQGQVEGHTHTECPTHLGPRGCCRQTSPTARRQRSWQARLGFLAEGTGVRAGWCGRTGLRKARTRQRGVLWGCHAVVRTLVWAGKPLQEFEHSRA